MNAPKHPVVTSLDPVEQYRISILSRFKEKEFQHLPREELLLAQTIAGHGDEWGIWKTPPSISPGKLQPSIRSINFAHRLRQYLVKDSVTNASVEILLEEGVLLMTRLSLLLRLVPTGSHGHSKNKRLKPRTLAVKLYTYWPKLVAHAIMRKTGRPDAGGLMSCLTREDVQVLCQNKHTQVELDRLAILAAHGLWSDLPQQPDITRTTNPKGSIRSHSHEESHGEYQPISDEYLAEIGPRILWLICELGPHLLGMLDGLVTYLTNLDKSGMPGQKIARRIQKFISTYLNEHQWIDRAGKPLMPPFQLTTGRKHPIWDNDIREWPPRTWDQIKSLSATLQSAQLFLALLATAGRIGEVDMLSRTCVEIARDGKDYLHGWTYKLSGNLFGDRRQWPAPTVLVQGLGQQSRLAAVWGRLPSGSLGKGLPQVLPHHDALWLSLGTSAFANPSEKLNVPQRALMMLAKNVGMDPRPDGINLHPHRFRKTIGRLAGIALYNSPLVLKRLFGHKNIEMTLHYILCDEDIRTESEKVLRELRIMNCAEVLQEIHEALASGGSLPGHGGPPAARLVEAVQTEEARLAKSGRLWTNGSAYDLAYLLTINGQGWRLIQKNIVCTKVPGENGLCRKNHSRGEPDTSNCRLECSNRFVLARERRDVNEVAESYIDIARQAREDEQFMVLFESMQRFSEEVEAFPNLKAHYLSDPDVQSLLASCEDANQ